MSVVFKNTYLFEPFLHIAAGIFRLAAIYGQTSEYCRIGAYRTDVADALSRAATAMRAERGDVFARQVITGQETFHRRCKVSSPDRRPDNQRVVLVHILHLCFQLGTVIALQLFRCDLRHLFISIWIGNDHFHFHDVATYKVVDMIGDCPGIASP